MFRDWSVSRIFHWSHLRLGHVVNAETVHENVSRMLHAFDPASIARYERLNLQVQGSLPRLDDVSSMASLMDQVDRSRDDAALSRIRVALIASSFFFELDCMPIYMPNGHYLCDGAIRIRGDAQLVLDLVRTIHGDQVQIVDDMGELVDVQLSSGMCWFCSRFNQPVRFIVRELDHTVNLSLRLGPAGEHRISGFPQKLRWFIAQQRLDDPFSPAQPSPDICICRSSTKPDGVTNVQVPRSGPVTTADSVMVANVSSSNPYTEGKGKEVAVITGQPAGLEGAATAGIPSPSVKPGGVPARKRTQPQRARSPHSKRRCTRLAAVCH